MILISASGGGHVRVSEQVVTSQGYTKIEHVETWHFRMNLANKLTFFLRVLSFAVHFIILDGLGHNSTFLDAVGSCDWFQSGRWDNPEYFEYNDEENSYRSFSGIPALIFFRSFTGTAEKATTYCRWFSGKTSLTQLHLRLNNVNFATLLPNHGSLGYFFRVTSNNQTLENAEFLKQNIA